MSASLGMVASFSLAVLASPECAWHHQNTAFTRKGSDEAFAAARENKLLEEASYKTSASGNLAVIYTITGFRKETVSKYL